MSLNVTRWMCAAACVEGLKIVGCWGDALKLRLSLVERCAPQLSQLGSALQDVSLASHLHQLVRAKPINRQNMTCTEESNDRKGVQIPGARIIVDAVHGHVCHQRHL